MRDEYTAQEIASITGLHRASVVRRAVSMSWQSREEAKWNSGSSKKIYLTASIDPEFLKRIVEAEKNNLPVPSTANLPAVREEAVKEVVSQWQIERAGAKQDLLIHYNRALKKAPHGQKATARESFIAAYNSGWSFPQLYQTLGRLSWQAIESWRRTVRSGGSLHDLADRRGKWRRGKSLVTAQQAVILAQCALHPNAWTSAEIIREAKKRMAGAGIENGHSEQTYRRWLREFQSHNDGIWCWSRGGKKQWNDECCLSIDRDPELINVGDVLVGDGHKLNFEILNPWTGKPQRMILVVFYDMRSNFPCGWEISPTENTAAISAALRRAILTLGKIPQVVYLDNGRAFKSQYFTGEEGGRRKAEGGKEEGGRWNDNSCFQETDFSQAGLAGVYAQLGIQTVFAWAYHGQSKTVERFFGVAAELERQAATYTGTSIEKKPPRMNRGETLHRRVYEAVMAGRYLTMEMAHRAVAEWFDAYAQRPQQKSKYLKGYTPADLFTPGRGPGIDAAALNCLMWGQADVAIRASRIQFLGRNYYHPALYNRRHPAEIRYDLQDPGFIVVYEKGEFICVATEQDKVHPMAILGTDEDKALVAKYCEIKKRQEKEAAGLAKLILEGDVLPAHQRRMELLGIEAEDRRLKAEGNPKQITMSPEEEARIAAEVRDLQAGQAEMQAGDDCEEVECEAEVVDEAAEIRFRLSRMSEADRYEALMEMELQGQLLCREYRAFLGYYELTDEYERHREYYEGKRAALAAAYGSATK